MWCVFILSEIFIISWRTYEEKPSCQGGNMTLLLLTVCHEFRFRGCAVLYFRKHHSAVISYSVIDLNSHKKRQTSALLLPLNYCFLFNRSKLLLRFWVLLLCKYAAGKQSDNTCSTARSEQVMGIKQCQAWAKTEMGHGKHLIWNSLTASENPRMNFYANAHFFSLFPPCLSGTWKQSMCWNKWDKTSTRKERLSRKGNSAGKKW